MRITKFGQRLIFVRGHKKCFLKCASAEEAGNEGEKKGKKSRIFHISNKPKESRVGKLCIYLGVRWVKDAIATGSNYVVVIFWLRGRRGERVVSVSTTVRSCDPTCLLRTEYDIIDYSIAPDGELPPGKADGLERNSGQGHAHASFNFYFIIFSFVCHTFRTSDPSALPLTRFIGVKSPASGPSARARRKAPCAPPMRSP